MPRKVPLSKELQLLEAARRELKARLKQLAHEQSCLLLRQSLLHAWCESLSLMHVDRSESLPAKQSELYAKLLRRELGLLEQLTHCRDVESFSYDLADVLHPGITTIAPMGDQMAYFRFQVSRPPLEAAQTMTSLDLAKFVREATLQASVLLHSLEDVPPNEQAPIIQQMEEIWSGCTHAAMSLIMAGREDIVETMNLINLETLQPDPEGSLHVTAQAARTASRLQLTPQQQSIIATGTGMYMRLLENIKQERQQLQLQFAAAPEAESHVGDLTDAGNTLHTRSQAWQRGADTLCSRQVRLEAEQQRIARLQLLMQKEYFLRMGGMAWIVGCLSWPQMSKAASLFWPFPVRMSLLAREIQKQWEAQQQWQILQELDP